MLDLFPDTASIDEADLSVGGIRSSALASRFGTPFVVYDENTILGAARAYLSAAPEARIVYVSSVPLADHTSNGGASRRGQP